jgi:hypothetical protein
MADDQRSVEVAGNALEATVLVHALVLKLVVEGVLTRETATSFVDAIVRLFEEAGPAVGAVGSCTRAARIFSSRDSSHSSAAVGVAAVSSLGGSLVADMQLICQISPARSRPSLASSAAVRMRTGYT